MRCTHHSVMMKFKMLLLRHFSVIINQNGWEKKKEELNRFRSFAERMHVSAHMTASSNIPDTITSSNSIEHHIVSILHCNLTFQSSNEGLFFKVKSSHENNNQIDYRIHLNWSQRVRNIFSNSGHTFTHRTRKKLTHILSIGTNTHAQTHPSMSNNAK